MANKRVQRKVGVREQQYTKLRNRLLQNIRRAEKRGYRFSEQASIPTAKQLRKQTGKAPSQKVLKELETKLKTYLESAQAISEETGKVITGTERRAEERRASARKGVETRRRRLEEASKKDGEFEKRRREQDEKFKQYAEANKEFKDKLQLGTITYEYVLGIIDENVKVGRGSGGSYLLQTLNDEIEMYGFDTVMICIAEAPSEFKRRCEIVVEASDWENIILPNIEAIISLITGTVPTAEELKRTAQMSEESDYEDFVE